MSEWIWHWSGYAVALVALVGVVWALAWDRPRGRKRCRRCWYDLSGAGGGASDVPIDCPECGRAHSKPRHLTRTRRRWLWAVVLGLVMVVGGYGLWVVPRVQDEGGVGTVPSTVMVLAAPVVPLEFMWSHPIGDVVFSRLFWRMSYDFGQVEWRLTGMYWSWCDAKMHHQLPEDVRFGAGDPTGFTVADSHFEQCVLRGYASRDVQRRWVEHVFFDEGVLWVQLLVPAESSSDEQVYLRSWGLHGDVWGFGIEVGQLDSLDRDVRWMEYDHRSHVGVLPMFPVRTEDGFETTLIVRVTRPSGRHIGTYAVEFGPLSDLGYGPDVLFMKPATWEPRH